MVAGAVFTVPPLYILKPDPPPVQMIFICMAGITLLVEVQRSVFRFELNTRFLPMVVKTGCNGRGGLSGREAIRYGCF